MPDGPLEAYRGKALTHLSFGLSTYIPDPVKKRRSMELFAKALLPEVKAWRGLMWQRDHICGRCETGYEGVGIYTPIPKPGLSLCSSSLNS